MRAHARIYVPTHYGIDGSREVVCRCRCGYYLRMRHDRQKDAAAAYREHLEAATSGPDAGDQQGTDRRRRRVTEERPTGRQPTDAAGQKGGLT